MSHAVPLPLSYCENDRRGTEFSLFFPLNMQCSQVIMWNSNHTQRQIMENYWIFQKPSEVCQKWCCFYSTELLEAKTKAVGATATSRSLMLLFLFFFFFHVGVGIQVRGFGGLSETMISVGSVISLAPSQAVLNCSGTGNSLWKKAIRARLFKPRLCKWMDG